jgi:cytochrome c553
MRVWILGALVLCGALLPGPCRAETIAEKAATCLACHGEEGLPTAPEIPVIFGQHEGYLYLQLRDFKLGVRKNEIMNGIAGGLAKDEMKALAAHFAAKPWPRLAQPAATPDQAAIAQRTNIAGQCTSCHMEGYLGASTAPRLAGQQQAYLELTLSQFKTKQRANNPGMSSIMETFPDADLAATAAYLAGLN